MSVNTIKFIVLIIIVSTAVAGCGSSNQENNSFTNKDLVGTWELTVVFRNTSTPDAQESWNQTIEMNDSNVPVFSQPAWQDGRDLQISQNGEIYFRIVLHAQGPPRDIDHNFQGQMTSDKIAASGTHSGAYTGTWQWRKIQ